MTMIDGVDSDGVFAQLRVRIAKALKGFESGLPEGCDPWSLRGGRPDPKLFPVPELVLFALREVMGFRWSGVGEKVRWSVYATIDGEPFVFQLRKFGFVIDYRDGISQALVKRVEGQLSSSLQLLEPLLGEIAKGQIAEGNLTLANRMGEFTNRYEYFRKLASDAFAPDPEMLAETSITDGAMGVAEFATSMTARMNRSVGREQDGYFASGAMVDAYFSRLEHRVLLLRAFIGRPIATGDFKAFLKKPWDQRLCEVADFTTNPARGKLLGQLREIRATIRNPLAHGGVENDGGAFYFHLPRVGAIPANLSRYRGRVSISFFPIASGTHTETCALFDELDAVLEQGALELPNQFVRWGIDPQFDAEAITRYAKAIAGGVDAVDTLVEQLSRNWERHSNMDY